MREREIHRLKAMVGALSTLGPRVTPTSFREAWMELKLGLVQSHFLYQIRYTIPRFVQH